MSIAPSDLEEALRRVQQGLMQPDEAARWLLQHAGSPHSPAIAAPQASRSPQAGLPKDATALSDLLTTLGPPPPEIQADWDHQLSTLIQEFERTSGQPIGELYASDFLVDAENRLSFSPTFWASLENASPSPAPFTSEQASPPLTRVADTSPSEKQTSSKPPTATRQSGNCLKAFAQKHRWATPLAVLATAAAVMGLAFYGFTRSDSESPLAKGTTAPANVSTDSIFSPDTTPTRKQDAAPELPSPQAEPTELGYLDPAVDATASAATSETTSAPQPGINRSTIGLDSFGTADWVSASDLLPAAEFDADKVEAVQDDSPAMSAGSSGAPPSIDTGEMIPADDLEQNDAPDSPPAPDSITVAAQDTNTVELPALPTSAKSDQEPASVVLIDQPATAVELLFPADLGLSIRGPTQQGGAMVWAVNDAKDDATLATLTSFSGGMNEGAAATDSPGMGLSFNWSSLATTRPKAKQLSSGLLKVTFSDGQKRSLFLRPRLSAQPWPVDYSEPDVKVAWPITCAPPANAAELHLEFEVPKTVTQSWVQAHDVKQWRRSQSLVEFKLQSDPSIAIRSRIDLRTGNRIQLRMRHAAQIDPSFPWMSVSTSRIENAAADITQRLTLANAQLAEVKSAYARAGQSSRRVMADRRDAIETLIANLEALNKRLIKYDQLISLVDKTTALSVQLSVHWPESAGATTQVVFHMPPEESAESK